MKPLLFSVLIVLSIACKTDNSDFPYNFSKPDKQLVLPDTLREISDITHIDSTTIACVQDENGIVFFYDLNSNTIVRELPFSENGDYEGIARVGANLFVLRSDGTLFEIVRFESESPKVRTYRTGTPARNSEGLCYDKAGNRLLIAVKGKSAKGAEYKNIREVFAFDLATKKLAEKAALTFKVDEVIAAAERLKVRLPVKDSKKAGERSFLRFTTSAIALHPATGELYLISSLDKILMVFNKEGQILKMTNLQQDLFNKAEGITFLDSNTIAISNEGQRGKPRILMFNGTKN